MLVEIGQSVKVLVKVSRTDYWPVRYYDLINLVGLK